MPSIEARRNANGEVTSYRIIVSAGLDYQGKQVKRRSIWTPPSYGMSECQMEREARAAAYKFEEQIRNGYELDNNQTFAEYAQYVLDLKERNGLSPRTLDRYIEMLPRINQSIGHLKLNAIRPQHLNELYKELGGDGVRLDTKRAIAKPSLNRTLRHARISKAELSRRAHVSASTISTVTHGRPVMPETAEAIAQAFDMSTSSLFTMQDDDEPLSRKTILEHHRLISSILAQADKELLVPYNAAQKATPPKTRKPDQDYYQPEEMRDILQALQDAPLKWKAITYLLIDTGCRRGEIAGLKWEKVNFDSGIVVIDRALLYTASKGVYEGTTKTGNYRALRLAPQSLEVLKAWKEEYQRIKAAHKATWTDTPYIFVKDDGNPIHPDSITDWLNRFSLGHPEIPHLHPHAFRHTAASTLIANGVDLVTTAAELGHANANTTAMIYAHQITLARANAADVRAGVFATLEKM